MRQEDVFWAGVVGPLGSGPGYDRPYLVIQNNAFNSSRINKVVVCGLTSNLRWGTGQRVALFGGGGFA
jgi:mRNA interferase MazF